MWDQSYSNYHMKTQTNPTVLYSVQTTLTLGPALKIMSLWVSTVAGDTPKLSNKLKSHYDTESTERQTPKGGNELKLQENAKKIFKNRFATCQGVHLSILSLSLG